MVNVAVINYGQLNDYAAMLPEHVSGLHVFSHNPLESTAGFAHYEHVPDCEFVPYAELRLRELARDRLFDYVVTDNEYDLERVARLRTHLGVHGQTPDSALSFRDKVVMKEVAGKRVRTPRFAGLDTFADLLDFIDDVGYPVVVKPRKQGGSRDITVLRDAGELTAFSRRHWRDDLLAEEFVDGEVHHVDAVLADGFRFVSCSRYLRSCLGVFSGQNNGSLQLHPDDPVAVELTAFLDECLAAFDTPAVSAYHLEVFRTADGELLLCEIASRVGGARIPALTRATYGLDLLPTWLRLSTGLPVADPPRAAPDRLHGAVAIVPPGRAVRAPGRPPFEWVTEYEVNTALAAGAVAQNSTSHVCWAMVEGRDTAEVEARLWETETWLTANLVADTP
ncbi:ATP-grasp domain-containing protein [Amycolatopsis tolypomycina]|uniref:ATP-grasp domain-containing protein n=1 Tax=Amycolatopsis tolypomycina TaxID=208445 RepID=A0A1H4XSJ2_9PSEU|nr:ATP-grasp domain-containing protein [Amycolatopsis tolypomycina]SED08613.1 ATP-grasp domain-containing protein [Amycolatopsis tolypomycina]